MPNKLLLITLFAEEMFPVMNLECPKHYQKCNISRASQLAVR
jgi:hypothetical protein